MSLRDEFVVSGNRLFRWRSYLPVLLLPVLLLALQRRAQVGAAETWEIAWPLLCLAVVAAGLAVRAFTIGYLPPGTSGRGTHAPKSESLNTTGIYSLMRHPLYLGNFLIWVGVALFPRSAWALTFTVLVFWPYYERIMFAEEDFLRRKFGEAFEAWAARTPAVAPALRNWTPPDRPFSAWAVASREHSPLVAAALTFLLLELAGDFFAGRPLALGPVWTPVAWTTIGAYLLIRALKWRRRRVARAR